MQYKLHFEKNLLKEIEKLDKATKEQIVKCLERVADNSIYFKPLVGKLASFYSIRCGKYRILVAKKSSIDVLIVEIEHRKKVYD